MLTWANTIENILNQPCSCRIEPETTENIFYTASSARKFEQTLWVTYRKSIAPLPHNVIKSY